MKDLLTIRDATVRYLNGVLFKDLNFQIKEGEQWALVGPSGSGKSALLNTIAGKFVITHGEIHYHFYEEFIKYHQPDAYFTYHKLISLVEPRHHFRNLSNTTDFYYQQRYNSSDSEDALTVDRYLNTINHREGDSHWTYDRVIECLKLNALLDKQIIKLSNGETKRLLLAAALLKNPKLLLLDQPLTGLDADTRNGFNLIIEEIIASGIHVIIATSQHEVPEGITHVAMLEDKKIIKRIPVGQFKDNYEKNDAGQIDKHAIQLLLNTRPSQFYNWIVKMENVNISYGSKQVLKQVDWEIKQGERWALLGPNGAGKSTLLSLINGDNPQAYANNIILFDKQRGTGESIWDIKGKIGFVSPELHQYFPVDNSCLQVVESGYYDTLGLFRPSQQSRSEIAFAWMKALEIDRYARTLLKNVPASAQRLCLLARALIKSPPLLIFDEPCQGMDDHQQQHFKHIIDMICGMSNTSLIYVTHYQHEIPNSVTYTLRLDQGRVLR